MAHIDPAMLRMLEAIAAVEPADRLPDTLTQDDRDNRLGPAYRNGWITISGFTGDGRLIAGQVLRLTPEGHDVVRTARDQQDAHATDAAGTDFAEKERRRSELLRAIYDATGGSTGIAVSSREVGAALGWDEAVTRPVVRYLYEHDLITYRAMNGVVAITKDGIAKVEQGDGSRAPVGMVSVTASEQAVVQVVGSGSATNVVASAVEPPAHPSMSWRLRAFRRVGGWLGVLILGVLASLIAAVIFARVVDDSGADTPASLTVDFRVTNGVTGMRDAPGVLRLAREPSSGCLERPSCVLGDVTLASGDAISAVCQVQGDRVTNGNDQSTADDDNPGLVESSLWYGVREDDGVSYVSEVWVEEADRGGHNLPRCG